MKRWVGGVAIVGAIGLLAFFAFDTPRYFRSVTGSPTYSCEELVAHVIQGWSDPAAAPTHIVDVRQVSSSSDLVDCEGGAILPDGRKIGIGYRAIKMGDQWRVVAEPT